jgi:hypothetical protein
MNQFSKNQNDQWLENGHSRLHPTNTNQNEQTGIFRYNTALHLCKSKYYTRSSQYAKYSKISVLVWP